MTIYNEIGSKIDSLAVFRQVKEDPTVVSLRKLLNEKTVASYSDFIAGLYPNGANISEYIRKLVLEDDNFYVKAVAAGQKVDPEIVAAVKNELMMLNDIGQIPSAEVRQMVLDSDSSGGQGIVLPKWTTSDLNLVRDFTGKLADISTTGYGIYAKYRFFRVEDGQIVPVAHPDYQSLDQLFEYERERDLVIRNTEALLDRSGASNMLLYGDMGTGKSTTVKAVAAAYADQGLRLIEIKKNQLFQIPSIMEEISANPLKFILFIDDLSFAGNDDNFAALKATLEGSITGCGDNAVIYATSNRRHLVRESAADRVSVPGFDEDLHVNDTMQETMSLAARFGLTITFSKPGKDEYLSIVRSLADEYGIAVGDGADEISETELNTKAEAFAIRRNGRSPRTARQFIELLKIGI
ncbi:MAG: ATP-binding protein [Clostridiales bacterium]|nr:ATP-binding protein [Clostridiales bacterium]